MKNIYRLAVCGGVLKGPTEKMKSLRQMKMSL